MPGRLDERSPIHDPITNKRYPAGRSRSQRRDTSLAGPPARPQALGLPSGTPRPPWECRRRDTTSGKRRASKGEEDENGEEEDLSLTQLCMFYSPAPGNFTPEIAGYKGLITDPDNPSKTGTLGAPLVPIPLGNNTIPVNTPPSVPLIDIMDANMIMQQVNDTILGLEAQMSAMTTNIKQNTADQVKARVQRRDKT